MQRKRLALAALVLAGALAPAAAPPPCAAQVEGSTPFEVAGTDAPSVAAFLKALREAVAKDDREAVADLVSYPCRLHARGRDERIKTRRQFLRLYPELFDRQLKAAIAAATVDTTFANWQGVMIDDGRLWFGPDESGKLGIITINAPLGRSTNGRRDERRG